MKKILVIIVLILGVISCTKQNKKTKSDKNLIIKKHVPLFIGLSPKMTDKEFENGIAYLNKKNRLVNGCFVIPVREKLYNFYVSKTEKTIRLNYYIVNNTIPYNNFDSNIADQYIREDEINVSNIIQIFDDKYGTPKIKFPLDAPLEIYDLEEVNYNIYQDSLKTILVGFRTIGSRNGEISFLEGLEDAANNVNPNEKELPFGFEIIINYFYNEDFTILLKKIQIDTELMKEKRRQKLKEEADKKLQNENNLKSNLKVL